MSSESEHSHDEPPLQNITEIKVDANHLYREEVFTDLRIATIRRLTPVRADGTPDPSRPALYSAQTTLMSQAGPAAGRGADRRRDARGGRREVPGRDPGGGRPAARGGARDPPARGLADRRAVGDAAAAGRRARRRDHPLTELRVSVGERVGSVSALLDRPRGARALLRARARRRRGHAPRVHGGGQRAARRRRDRDVPLPVSVHGAGAPRARSARRAHGDRARGASTPRRRRRRSCRCSRAANRSAAA